MKDIAVIDLAVKGLFLYRVDESLTSEEIEIEINKKGHHLSNCSWGEYDGEIVDLR